MMVRLLHSITDVIVDDSCSVNGGKTSFSHIKCDVGVDSDYSAFGPEIGQCLKTVPVNRHFHRGRFPEK